MHSLFLYAQHRPGIAVFKEHEGGEAMDILSIVLIAIGLSMDAFAVSVTNGITKLIHVKLTDNLPAVEVKVDYQVTFLKQLIFTFQFSQDVLLDNIGVTNPNNGTTTLNYNGVLVSKNEQKGILILIVLDGTWSLTFNGRKAGGAQSNFSVTKTIKVKE
jgi:hypothetical protein